MTHLVRPKHPNGRMTRMTGGRSVFAALLVMVAVTALPAGCGGEKGSNSGGLADLCERAPREELLDALDRSCDTSTDCPAGSFCDVELGGFCNFRCTEDWECGPQGICDCLGRCGQPEQPPPPADPACPKDTTLLQSAAVRDRLCQSDDVCPHGAYCDLQTSRCRYNCLVDGDCAGAGTGAVCDCYGRCGAAGAPPPPVTERLPALSVTPLLIELPLPAGSPPATPPVKPSFSPRTVELRLTADTIAVGSDGVEQPQPTLRARAGRFLAVDCPPPRPGATVVDQPQECDIAPLFDWVALPGGGYEARTSFVILASDEAPLPMEALAPSWLVEISSAQVADTPLAISVRYGTFAAPVDSSAWPDVTSATEAYEGKAQITFLGPSGNLGGPAVALVPLVALGKGSELHLYDRTRVLSPTGVVRLSVAAGSTFEGFWTASAEGLAGGTSQQLTTIDLKRNPATGTLVGTFESGAPASAQGLAGPRALLRVRYELRPSTTFRSCAADGSTPTPLPCATGYRCNSSGFCSTSDDAGVPGSAGADFTHGPYEAWMGADRLAAIGTLGSDRPEKYTCTTGEGGGSFVISEPYMRFSGDPYCRVSGTDPITAPFTVPLLYAKDRFELLRERAASPSDLPPEPSASELFAACLEELAAPVPEPADVTQSPPTLGPGFLRDDAACISLGNFFAALYVSRPQAESDPVDTPFYLHLLRQWVELHAFMARQGGEEETLSQILGSARDPGDVGPDEAWQSKASYEELLDGLERGWGLVLGEATSGGTLNLYDWVSPGHYRFTDWRYNEAVCTPTSTEPRCALIPTGDQYEQASGLAPALLEGAAAHMALADRYLEQVGADTYEASLGAVLAPARDRALARIGSVIRIGNLVHGLAGWIHDDAVGLCAGATPPPVCNLPFWEERWGQALAQFEMARGRLVEGAVELGMGGNPLGLQEDDLPLYFGDVTGNTSRYFAASDYLINQWALPAAMSAEAKLALARDAWIAARNSVVQDELLAAERERRLEQIATSYGQAIIENCGVIESSGGPVEARDVLGLFGPAGLTPMSCFIAPGCPEATSVTDNGGANELTSALTAQMVRFQACKWKKMQSYLSLPPDIATCLAKDPSTWEILASPFAPINCQDAIVDHTEFWGDYGELVAPLEEARAAQETCEAENGVGRIPVPELEASCLQGRMGEAVSQVVRAKEEVNVALAHLQTTEVSFNEKSNQCILAMSNAEQQAQARAAVAQLRQTWADMKGVARSIDQVTGTLQGAMTGANYGAAAGPYGAIAGAIIGGVAGFWKSGLQAQIDKAETNLKLAESAYSDLVQAQAAAAAVAACLGEAHVLKVAIDADIATIRARAADVTTAIVAFDNLVSETSQKVIEGREVLEREEGRPWGGYAHHFWFDEKVERFRREFAWAKRLTYMALRAVEYEFQQSLPLRKLILTARHPDELLEALHVLQQEQAARTINRRRPEELSLVLSVRDDVLRIADRSGEDVAGERNWTPAQRFRGRILAPQYAVRDEAGNWLGQGVRFALDPAAATAVQGGIALGYRCGERLWRVTASLQGDGLSPKEPGAPLLLLKQNSFSSQWCEGHGEEGDSLGGGASTATATEGAVMQSGAIQPSRQLFRPDDVAAPVDESQGYTAAAIYSWFNIRRAEFYREPYQDGSSEELAGRGLYGDYILLFPRELIESTFKTARVEDILIRLDYLSVDDLPGVSAVNLSGLTAVSATE